MSRKPVSAVMMSLLVLGTLALAFDVRPVKSDYAWTETIYIQADGSIQPPTAPISSGDNVTYTLTDNIVGDVPSDSSAITIERDNIIIDGAGHALQGTTASNSFGIELAGSNVTIKNMKITAFDKGIVLYSSVHNSVIGNNITANDGEGIVLGDSSNNNSVTGNYMTGNGGYGVYLGSSDNNSVSGNNITNNWGGIWLDYSYDNSVSGNYLANNSYSIYLDYSSNNSMSGNKITNSSYAFYLYHSFTNNSISGNNITNNEYAIWLESSSNNNTIIENYLKSNAQYNLYLDNSSDNRFYLNSFITSTGQAYMYLSANSWDNGYPCGGNYWSTHAGGAIDLYRGVGQNETGIDGIGDSPYIFGSNETDHYPLMGPFGSSTMTGLNVTVFPAPDVGLIFSNVTAAGDVVLNKTLTIMAPVLVNLTGEYYDIKVTATSSGKITIRIIYDDSNMTAQRESNLTMMQYTPIPGDIRQPFGQLDIKDISYIAKHFGTTPASPNWDPIADITGPTPMIPDGKVDIKDISLAAKNFGKISQWINITTYVDTTNNVIYGETTHFSLIGIH